MTRDEIIRYTKTIIDEVSPIDGLMDDIKIEDFGSDKPIDDFIATLIDESADETQLLAPTYYLRGKSLDENLIVVLEGDIAKATKPNGFLKCILFRLPSWKRAVTTTVREGSVRGDMQWNPYLRGGVAKPIVLENNDSLFFIPFKRYDATATSALKRLEYAYSMPAEEVVDCLQTPICWLTASKVLSIVGNLNGSKVCKEKFTELLQEVQRREV